MTYQKVKQLEDMPELKSTEVITSKEVTALKHTVKVESSMLEKRKACKRHLLPKPRPDLVGSKSLICPQG